MFDKIDKMAETQGETEIFVLREPDRVPVAYCNERNRCFDTNRSYLTAPVTRQRVTAQGWKYYTTHPLRNIGRYVRTELVRTDAEQAFFHIFDNNGQLERVPFGDQNGYIEAPASGGRKRRYKKTRKAKKHRKASKRTRKH